MTSLILNHLEFLHAHVFTESVTVKALMSHLLHSSKAILLANLRSKNLTLVSNRLKISFMVANNSTIVPLQYPQ